MNPTNAVPLQPWVEFLQPYVTILATTIVPVIAAWLAIKLSTLLGVSTNATQIARIKSAAATEAGALVAAAADNLKDRSIPINDPRVVAAAAVIAARLPGEAAAVGATPEVLQKIVAGEIGKLQAAQSLPTVTVAPVVSVEPKV